MKIIVKMNNNINISIILCCYNSVQKLPQTLEHLAKQKISENIKYEVILVDNSSTDKTGEFASLYWKSLSCNAMMTIVYESKPGLIYARIKGLKSSKGEIIIFCDDDNWLEENYILLAYNFMKKNPNVGVLGGMGECITENEISLPEWWNENENYSNYAVGKQLKYSGKANSRGYIWGAGMVTRREILEKVFDERFPFLMTGRSGNLVLSGEDSEICSRVRILGYDLFYNENLKYKHFMTANRLTEEYLRYLLSGFENVVDMQLEYKNAILYLNMNFQTKIRLFFVRYLNRLFNFNNKNKQELFRQYNAYVLGLRNSTIKNYRVVYDFIKAYR